MSRWSLDEGNRVGLTVCSDGGEEQVDRLLDALGTYRRRCVLYCLLESESADLTEIARAVAAMEGRHPPDEISPEVLENVKADLYHHTLPKLAALNVIEYDPRTETVCYRHPPAHLEEFLELTQELDPV